MNLPSLTVMDGDLPSIYYYSDKKAYYTLTHSKYTHIKKFKNIANLDKFKKKISIKILNNLKNKSVASISKFYDNFEKKFSYKGYFLSYKILPLEQSDKRETYFYKESNLLSFFSAKISNIFTAETIISKIIDK
jgi:sulfatase maturation enzyme AslB (radical SAM superfamily)